jgi:hypothetical protein
MNDTTQQIDQPGPETEILVDPYPAYDLYRRTGRFGKPMEIRVGDTLGVRRSGYIEEYRPGSVVSYAMSSGECPIKAVTRAKSYGHQLHWINGCAVCITARKQAKRRLIEVSVGMVVLFEGRKFKITAEPNSNLGLKQIGEAL